jgi:phosphopantothenoylcysteine decarboxylase/phosphopantothenate--cysteine ligase
MRILVTAGPTREHIDDVRFISNPSSGRMGYTVAGAAAKRGHEVDLISGPVDLEPPEGVHAIRVTSAVEMLDAVLERIGETDILIMAAAVSDWRPKERFTGKIGKETDTSSMELVLNPDILKEATSRNPDMLAVAFALEMDMDVESALAKMKKKGAGLVVLNTVEAMGAYIADFAVYSRQGNPLVTAERSKEELADSLLDLVEEEKSR